MTRRERKERKLTLRREWAEKRRQKSKAAYDRAGEVLGDIPLGQPILVGHHSEKKHRSDLQRHDSAMRRADWRAWPWF